MYRHDPVLAAAEVALHLEKEAKSTGAVDSVATTGSWHIKSNNINSVPSEAKIEVDIRDIDLKRRDAVVDSMLQKAKGVAKERGVELEVEQINRDPPTSCGDEVTALLLHATVRLPHMTCHCEVSSQDLLAACGSTRAQLGTADIQLLCCAVHGWSRSTCCPLPSHCMAQCPAWLCSILPSHCTAQCSAWLCPVLFCLASCSHQ